MMVWLLFIIDLMGLFFYNKIGSIISIGDLPTTNIIEPYFLLYNFAITSRFLVKFLRYLAKFLFRYHIELKVYHFQRCP